MTKNIAAKYVLQKLFNFLHKQDLLTRRFQLILETSNLVTRASVISCKRNPGNEISKPL